MEDGGRSTAKRNGSYQDLKVWQVAMDLAEACYEVSRSFPQNEAYGMTSQLRRASVSIAANIAEGYGREHRGSFVQFLRMAQGSLKEVETHLILSGRVGLMRSSEVAVLLAKCEENGKMLRALIRAVQRKSVEGKASS